MSVFEDALRQVIDGKPALIACMDKKKQEATRVILYHLKKKLIPPHMQEEIGITKVEMEDQLFVKVYQRPVMELYTLDENGKLLPVMKVNKEQERIKELMRKDGKTEEEIEELLKAVIN